MSIAQTSGFQPFGLMSPGPVPAAPENPSNQGPAFAALMDRERRAGEPAGETAEAEAPAAGEEDLPKDLAAPDGEAADEAVVPDEAEPISDAASYLAALLAAPVPSPVAATAAGAFGAGAGEGSGLADLGSGSAAPALLPAAATLPAATLLPAAAPSGSPAAVAAALQAASAARPPGGLDAAIPAGADGAGDAGTAPEAPLPTGTSPPQGPSGAVQTSRAVSGFGQGLAALSPPGPAGPTAPPPAEAARTAQAIPAPVRAEPQLPKPRPAVLPEGTTATALTEPAVPEALDLAPLAGGTPAQGSAAPGAPPVVAAPAQLAPVILAVAPPSGSADVTVTLSPEELGTLHLRVATEGETLRVTILADRPETLDLMRRHGEQLLADLRSLGFGGATLGFGGSGSTPQNTGGESPAAPPAEALPAPPPPAPSRLTRAGGLDIRL